MSERYWLVKSEPDDYSIDDLARDRVTSWDGVRSFQARIYIRDQMQVGDGVLVYHSNATPPGIVGLARVASAAYPDPSQFDASSPYHDPTSDPADPRWLMIDVEFQEKFDALVPLDVLRQTPGLEDMKVIQRGMRLSVQPVTPGEWEIAVGLGRRAASLAADWAEAAKTRPSKGKTAAKAKAKQTKAKQTKAKPAKAKAKQAAKTKPAKTKPPSKAKRSSSRA